MPCEVFVILGKRSEERLSHSQNGDSRMFFVPFLGSTHFHTFPHCPSHAFSFNLPKLGFEDRLELVLADRSLGTRSKSWSILVFDFWPVKLRKTPQSTLFPVIPAGKSKVPSGKHTKKPWKITYVLMAKSTINLFLWPFSIAFCMFTRPGTLW